MAWNPPLSPTLGMPYELAGRRWVWNGAGWAKAERNSFMRAVLLDDYRQTLVTTARTMPLNAKAVLLEYI